MPISSHAVIPYILEEVLRKRPKHILDLGIGNGIYGALIYNYGTTILDALPRLVGVEGWGAYEGPLWDCYDEIHVEDLREFTTTQLFDIIIMADVIEHFSLIEGEKQLKRYKAMLRPKGVMIISTPAIFVPQGAHEGNALEQHKSLWTDPFFKRSGFAPLETYKRSTLGEKMHIYKFKNRRN